MRQIYTVIMIKKKSVVDFEGYPLDVFTKTLPYFDVHHHVEYEIIYLEEGTAVCKIGKTENVVEKGTVIFIESFADHSIMKKNPKEVFRYYSILFDISVLGNKEDSLYHFFSKIRVPKFITVPQNILDSWKEIAELKKSNFGINQLYKKSFLFDLISSIIKSGQYEIVSPLDDVSKRKVSAIENTLKYIKENYRENISMDSVLDLTNYSKSHFIRLFKESTGMNLSEYINKYRIERACLDLLYKNKNITEVATENGFNNIQYFSRVFKNYMKCTPKQYQKKKARMNEPFENQSAGEINGNQFNLK